MDIAAYVAQSTKQSGVPLKVADAGVLSAVASLIK